MTLDTPPPTKSPSRSATAAAAQPGGASRVTTPPAIAVLELDSIALGLRAADAMVKKAPIDVFRIGTVHPGKYLILVGGSVAAVDESRREGLRIGGESVTDDIFLPDIHPQVYAGIEGQRRDNAGDALGVIETSAIPINVAAADKAIKTADVSIVEIRLGDDLGGKGITVLTGLMHDVEAAIAAGIAVAQRPGVSMHHTIIPIQHGELRDRIRGSTWFHPGQIVPTASEHRPPEKRTNRR